MMYNIRSGAIRWKIPDLLSDGNSNVCIFQHLLVKIVTWKVSPWKFSLIKVMEYNFQNDAFWWQMSKSTNVIFYIFDFR